jgi:hypothetical protein
MHLYVHYKRTFDENIFRIWINHYNRLSIEYGIFVESADLDHFKFLFDFSSKNIIDTSPKDVLQITEKDLLFPFSKTPDLIMQLSYSPDEDFYHELKYNSTTIGRLFYVPVFNKLMYSTFEIPDFILYQHQNHSHFKIHGIKVNGGGPPSSSIVCLHLDVLHNNNKPNEYYETNIVINRYVSLSPENKIIDPFFSNVYLHYKMNVIVNKEKQYGIVWYPKSACSTLSNLFCLVNQIDLEEPKPKRSLNFFLHQYRFHSYLENIEMIAFVRNPYTRFLSSFIDKHIFKTDDIFLTLEGYQDYRQQYPKDCIYNLCKYLLNGKYISDHYLPMIHFAPLFNEYSDSMSSPSHNSKIHWHKIEDHMNENLYSFLKKYHPDLEKNKILTEHENSICQKNNSPNKINELNPYVKYFDENQWKLYLDRFNINYQFIIDADPELKEMIYTLYKHDFEKFGYAK